MDPLVVEQNARRLGVHAKDYRRRVIAGNRALRESGQATGYGRWERGLDVAKPKAPLSAATVPPSRLRPSGPLIVKAGAGLAGLGLLAHIANQYRQTP